MTVWVAVTRHAVGKRGSYQWLRRMPKQPTQGKRQTNMKKFLTLLTLTAFAAAPAGVLAAKKEAAPAAAPAAEAKPAPAKPEAPAVKPPKATGMSTTVDAIDAATKSFTHANKDGKVVKFNVLDTTEIKNGDAAAKFEDIKVGDTVNGSRIKKKDDGTEYDVVKITKIVPAAAKEKKADDAKKPAAPAAPVKKAS